MSRWRPRPARPARRARFIRGATGRGGERGAALVEMAMVIGLLALFLFGIVTFGITLSFKQSLSQAANEAARAAAVAPYQYSVVRAETAANRVAAGWDSECNDDQGLTCSFVISPCTNGTQTTQCMTVELTYDLENYPRVPSVPIVSNVLPDELVSTVVVEVNGPSP